MGGCLRVRHGLAVFFFVSAVGLGSCLPQTVLSRELFSHFATAEFSLYSLDENG